MAWTKDESGIWISKHRFGQISGNKYAFFNAVFDKNRLLATTLNGAFYAWKIEDDDDVKIFPTVTGHYAAVTDLDWSSS